LAALSIARLPDVAHGRRASRLPEPRQWQLV
jgi:hypothetical protein